MPKFDPAKRRNELAKTIAQALDKNMARFAGASVRGLAIDCHPWHRVLELCLCTDADEVKWDLADWKHFQFTRTPDGDKWPETVALCQAMFDYCEADDDEDYQEKTTLMIQVCAQALLSSAVKKALKDYKLADDFELFVSHPDDPDENLCETESELPSF